MTKIIEKPAVEIARAQLRVDGLGEDEFLGWFGMHILTPSIYDILAEMIRDDVRNGGEFQLTCAQEIQREREGYMALEIRDGQTLRLRRADGFRAQLGGVCASGRVRWRMREPRKKLAAFTLIELLVVISIVAVLAAILLPVFNTVTLRADRVTALSQMRQIWIGIASYSADHNNKFPGPLYPGQLPMLDPARDGRLVLTLAPYLGITIPTQPQLIPLFIPPAYRRAVTPVFLNDARTYVLNMAVPVGNGTTTLNPWGNSALTGQQPLACALVPGRGVGVLGRRPTPSACRGRAVEGEHAARHHPRRAPVGRAVRRQRG